MVGMFGRGVNSERDFAIGGQNIVHDVARIPMTERTRWLAWLSALLASCVFITAIANPTPPRQPRNAQRVQRFKPANLDFEQGTIAWRGGAARLRIVPDGKVGRALEIAPLAGDWQYAIQWDAARLEVGRQYVMSAWVKASGDSVERFRFGLWDNHGRRWVAATDATATPEWTHHRFHFTNSSANPLSIEIGKSSPSPAALLVDTIRLDDASDSPPTYVQNGQFEAGTSGWDASAATLASAPGLEGRGLALHASSGSYQYAIQWNGPVLDRGVAYQFRVAVRSGTAGDQPFQAGIWDPRESRWVATVTGTSSPTWREYRVGFTSTSSNPIAFELLKNSPTRGSMLFDSVGLEKLPQP
jgi:hypothetical protein